MKAIPSLLGAGVMPHGILSLSIPGHLSDLPPSRSPSSCLYDSSALPNIRLYPLLLPPPPPPCCPHVLDTGAPEQCISPAQIPAAHTAPQIFCRAPKEQWGYSCRWRKSSAGWAPALAPWGRTGRAGTGHLGVPLWAASSRLRWSSRRWMRVEPWSSRRDHPCCLEKAPPLGVVSEWEPEETAWAPKRIGPSRWWQLPGWFWLRAPWRCRRCPGCQHPVPHSPWEAVRVGHVTCPPWAWASDPEPRLSAWFAPGQLPSSLGPDP